MEVGMIDKPVWIGKAINEAAEKQEWEAIRVIGEHIADYLLGEPDLETEDIELGRKAGVTDLEVIKLRWKVARKKRAKLKEEAAASFKKPSMQPSIEPPKPTIEPAKIGPSVEPPKIGPRKVVRWQKIAQGWFYSVDGGKPRRHLGPLPKAVQAKLIGGVPQLKVVDQAKPEPEPEPWPAPGLDDTQLRAALAGLDQGGFTDDPTWRTAEFR